MQKPSAVSAVLVLYPNTMGDLIPGVIIADGFRKCKIEISKETDDCKGGYCSEGPV